MMTTALTAPGASNRVLQILVLETNERDRTRLIRQLGAMGHQAISDGSYRNIENHLGRSKPDLVLMSLNEPGAQVLADFSACIESCARHEILVIAMSAAPSVDQGRHLLEAGVADYLAKPVSRAYLAAKLRAIGRLLEAQHQARHLAGVAKAAQDNLGIAVWVVDENAVIRDANAAAVRLFKQTRENLVGSSVVALLGAELYARASSRITTAEEPELLCTIQRGTDEVLISLSVQAWIREVEPWQTWSARNLQPIDTSANHAAVLAQARDVYH